jgi:hypothetical protein
MNSKPSLPEIHGGKLTKTSEQGFKITTQAKDRRSDLPLAQNKENSVTQPTKMLSKRQSFACSESIITFDDFEVGQSYKKKLKLVNNSNELNKISSITLDQSIADVFFISFERVGAVAPGKDIDLELTFMPKYRTKLSLNLVIKAENGNVLVPVECDFKKTKIELESYYVDLGKTIVGEFSSKMFKVFNIGGLASKFEVKMYTKTDASKTRIQEPPKIEFDIPVVSDEQQIRFNEEVFNKFLTFEGEKIVKGKGCSILNFEFNPRQKEAEVFFGKIILHFDNFLDQPDIEVTVRAEAIQNPIRVMRHEYDMGICLLNSIYRQEIQFENNSIHVSKAEIRVVEKDYADYFQFNPVFSYIQPNSTFTFWLKYTINEKFIEIYRKRNKATDDTIVILCELKSSIQVDSVFFNIKLQYTTDSLTYPQKIDFGLLYQCTAKSIPIKIANNSKLVQKILFHSLPQNIAIEPLLVPMILPPSATEELMVIYKCVSSGYDSGVIKAKVLVGHQKGNEIEIPYSATGYECNLKLSAHRIDLNVAQENELIVSSIALRNTFSKDIVYEINAPDFEASGLKFSPSVAILKPGQTTELFIEFLGKFRKLTYEVYEKITEENAELKKLKVELAEFERELLNIDAMKKPNLPSKEKEKVDQQAQFFNKQIENWKVKIENLTQSLKDSFDPELALKALGGKRVCDVSEDSSPNGDGEVTKIDFNEKSPAEPITEPNRKMSLKINESERAVAQNVESSNMAISKLNESMRVKNITGDAMESSRRLETYKWLIPISFKGVGDPDTLASSTFLEVNTAVKPVILLVDRELIDFGKVVIGSVKKETFTVKNNGMYPMEIKMDVASIFSGFQFLGCLKLIDPGVSKTFSVAFDPVDENTHIETLRLFDDHAITVKFKGQGVLPELVLEPNVSVLDMGNILVGEEKTATFDIRNPSEFELEYSIEVEKIGTRNRNGKSEFYYTPPGGKIPSREKRTIKVGFQPSEESEVYLEVLYIKVNGRKCKARLLICGSAFSRQAFVKSSFSFTNKPIESLIEEFSPKLHLFQLPPNPFLSKKSFRLKFDREPSGNSGQLTTGSDKKKNVKKIIVGSCLIGKAGQDKPAEFKIELVKSDFPDLFKIDPLGGKIDAQKSIEISFEFIGHNMDDFAQKKQPAKPNAGKNTETINYEAILPNDLKEIGQWVNAVAKLKVSGGFVRPEMPNEVVYDVCLQAHIKRF